MPKDIAEKTDELGSIPSMRTSNENPTKGTTSDPNPVKRVVSVGRKGYTKQASHSTIESLRPGKGETSNG